MLTLEAHNNKHSNFNKQKSRACSRDDILQLSQWAQVHMKRGVITMIHAKKEHAVNRLTDLA